MGSHNLKLASPTLTCTHSYWSKMHHTRLVLESHPLCQDVLWILDGREAQWGLLDLNYQELLWVTDAVSKTFDDNKQSMCEKMQWSLYLAVRGHLCLLSGLGFRSKRSRCRTRVPGPLWVEPELPESSDNRINQAPQIPFVPVSRCQGAVTQTLLHGAQELKHTGRETNTPTPLRYPSCPVDKNIVKSNYRAPFKYFVTVSQQEESRLFHFNGC